MDAIALVEFGELAIFWIMGLASILAVAVGIERMIVFKRLGLVSKNLISDLIAKIRAKDFSSLKETDNKSVYKNFASFGSENFNNGHDSLSESLAGKIIETRIELETRLPILSTLGNNAPFLGLLGTVLGVIKAFNGLGTLGNSGAEVVMKSISTALLATAAGLFVAIPVVMTNNYFSKKLKVITQYLEILSKEFLASSHKK
jgi:biopolymer transport protein ExbB